jgi:hypothetical protein
VAATEQVDAPAKPNKRRGKKPKPVAEGQAPAEGEGGLSSKKEEGQTLPGKAEPKQNPKRGERRNKKGQEGETAPKDGLKMNADAASFVPSDQKAVFPVYPG